jgi:hypothetical protein
LTHRFARCKRLVLTGANLRVVLNGPILGFLQGEPLNVLRHERRCRENYSRRSNMNMSDGGPHHRASSAARRRR